MEHFCLPLKKLFIGRLSSNKTNPSHHRRTRPRKDPCGQRCNNFALGWFWLTVIGTVYTGFEYILPKIYPESPTIVFYNKVICYIILIEMVIHWCFLRWVKSPFQPERHRQYMNAHAHEVQHGGFEINMNDVKKTSAHQGSYKLPKSSINSNMNKNLVNGTLYVIEVDDDYKNYNNGFCTEENGKQLVTAKKKLVYPYWSWKPCIICQSPRPPRAHHCPICGTCVLKRDHHCFFSGSCVGLRNQRYFISFVFWGVLATLYCFVQAMIYFFTVYMANNPWYDIVLPIGLVRWVLGYVSSLDSLLLILLYSVSWFCLTAIAFLGEQINCIKKGITSFEQDTNIKITNSSDQKQNMKAVFGDYWLLSFIVPLHWIFPSQEDGVCWPNIKA